MDTCLQKSSEDEHVENSSFSQFLEFLKALESEVSVQPNSPPQRGGLHFNARSKKSILMRRNIALARVSLEEYREMFWENLNGLGFPIHLKEFDAFKDDCFMAMTWFVSCLYEEEFFQDIVDPITVADCRMIFEYIYKEENPKKALSELGIHLDKFRKISELNIGTIIEWYTAVTSCKGKMLKELPWFTSCEYYPSSPATWEDRYVNMAMDISNKSKYGLKREVKRHLLMELNDGKCSCVLDALYMQAWKRIPIASLEGYLVEDRLNILVGHVRRSFYGALDVRFKRLWKCRGLVKRTLLVFGSCDDDVLQVVEWADLERKTRGGRFINKDDLFTSLYQYVLGDGLPYGRINYLRSSDDVDKNNDRTVYQVYQRSQLIAEKEGKQNIGLEHLYIALMNGRADNESSWDKFKTWVGTTKSNNNQETGDVAAKLWRKALNCGEINLDSATAVKNIQDKNFCPLKDVIAFVLAKEVVLGKGFPEKYPILRYVLPSAS